MRLGDLDELRKQFDDIPVFIGMTGGCVQEFIDKQPTIDAVPVVRCKDCIVCYCVGDEDIVCGRTCVNVDADDFCSYGERKDGDG